MLHIRSILEHLLYIHFKCDSCGKHLEIDEKGRGMSVSCPDCSCPVVVPMFPEPCRCDRCAAELFIATSLLGSDIQCPKCRNMFYVASPNAPSGPQKIIPPQTRFLAGRKAGKRNSEGTQILPPMHKHGRNEFKGGDIESGQDGNASPKEFGDIPWWVGVLFILSAVLIKPEIRHAIVAIISGDGRPGRAYAVTRSDSEVRQQISRFKEYSYRVSSHIPEIDINSSINDSANSYR